MATVILQKNSEGYEQPIAFYNKSLLAIKFKYDIIETKAYALVKVVKNFRPYLVGSQVIAYVPNALVKEIFVQSKTTEGVGGSTRSKNLISTSKSLSWSEEWARQSLWLMRT